MKKLILLFTIVILLTGCSRIPKGMNKQTYEIGSNALEIIQKYNKAEVNKEDAKSRVDDLADQLDALNLMDGEADENLWVKVQLQQFVFQLSGSGSGDTARVEKTLKGLLGK